MATERRPVRNRAHYETIDDEEPYYGEVKELPGVYATGKTLEECRADRPGWLVRRTRFPGPNRTGGIDIDLAEHDVQRRAETSFAERITVTGNTVIDVLHWVVDCRIRSYAPFTTTVESERGVTQQLVILVW